jgi:pantoate--beta-alanine ligase
MEVVSRAVRLRSLIAELRQRRRPIGFVPTMGALHVGHLSLVRLARERGAEVVASIFVNPTQFGAGEDFAAYPRDLTRDCELLAKEGVACVFAPDAAEMYPAGFATHVEVDGLSDVLIGAQRPGHFRGVSTVVLKLLNLVTPDFAVLGMKDAQQLVIVSRMVADLNLGVEIVPAPTVREPDGLACSSRNAYLDEAGRKAATAIYAGLQEAIRRIHEGERVPSRVEDAVRAVLEQQPLLTVDHVKAVAAHDLTEPRRLQGVVLILVSVKCQAPGRAPTVLIDNVRVEIPAE